MKHLILIKTIKALKKYHKYLINCGIQVPHVQIATTKHSYYLIFEIFI